LELREKLIKPITKEGRYPVPKKRYKRSRPESGTNSLARGRIPATGPFAEVKHCAEAASPDGSFMALTTSSKKESDGRVPARTKPLET